jgi:hypothetical protein
VTLVRILEDAAAPILLERQASRKLVLGAALSLVPVLNLLPLGYVLTVLESASKDNPSADLPEWSAPGRLFVRGTVFALVILTYAAIPFLFTSAAFSLIRLSIVYLPPAVITLAIGAVMWVAAMFVLPLAMLLVVRRNSARPAFDLAEIWARSSLVLGEWFPATIINLGLFAALSLPLTVSPVGYFLSAPLAFLAMVFMAGVSGRICRRAGLGA